MTDAAAQLRRLLAFLPRIADGQEHSIADVAGRLGVDASTIRQDLHRLSERYGDPPGWIEKVAVYIESDRVSLEAASHFRRPMRLAPPELRALELGLSILRAESPPERQKLIESLLERLRQLSSHPERSEGSAVLDDPAHRAASIGTARSLEHVPALRDALRNRKRVAVTYHKGSWSRPERRTICPFTFVVEKGVWYLIAHCEKSFGMRIFRLDRIERIELLAESFEPPPSVDVDKLLAKRSAFVGEAPEKLKVRFSPRVARWIAEREQGTRLEDGSFEVEWPLGDVDWAVRHVLQYGAEAQVMSPAAVRDALVARLKAVLG